MVAFSLGQSFPAYQDLPQIAADSEGGDRQAINAIASLRLDQQITPERQLHQNPNLCYGPLYFHGDR